MIQAEAQHRDHAIIEQAFADLTSGPLAHLPSGSFAANAAWLTCAAMSHNLTRAAGALAGLFHARARGGTIRSHLIAVAARAARHGRGEIMRHLPEGWHREQEWMNLFEAACGPPSRGPDQPGTGHRARTAPAATCKPAVSRTRTRRRNSQRQGRHAPDTTKITADKHHPENDHLNSRGGLRLSCRAAGTQQ